LAWKGWSQRESCTRIVAVGSGWKGQWWHWMKMHLDELGKQGGEEREV
jgi:hypothetical protein